MPPFVYPAPPVDLASNLASLEAAIAQVEADAPGISARAGEIRDRAKQLFLLATKMDEEKDALLEKAAARRALFVADLIDCKDVPDAAAGEVHADVRS